MQEVWKDIKGYEGYYQVSNLGNVRRITKDGYRPIKARDGVYLTVSLSMNSKKKSFSIHRLVAETFIGGNGQYDEVNHKDGDKHNNKVDNLEFISQRKNLEHAMYELNHYPFGKKPRGVKKIDIETNEIIKTYPCVSGAAREIGIMSARTSITLVCQGYQKTAYGYKWEYTN